MNEHGAMSTGLAGEQGVYLTPRETEILQLVATGKTSQAIADELFVVKKTIDFHLSRIYPKLKVNNRKAACQKALNLGLIKATS